MEKFQYREKRYRIQAKRKDTDEQWTEWTIVDDYDEAVKHFKQIEELGYSARIVDKSGIANVVKMLEEEYEKAQKLDYVKNPLAFALYAVWKKVDKESKRR